MYMSEVPLYRAHLVGVSSGGSLKAAAGLGDADADSKQPPSRTLQ